MGELAAHQVLWMEEKRRVYERLVVDELVHLRALHLPVDDQGLAEMLRVDESYLLVLACPSMQHTGKLNRSISALLAIHFIL